MQPFGLPRHWHYHRHSYPLRGAGRELRCAFTAPLEQLPKPDSIRAWCAVAYAFPGLHPDGYEAAGSGWPRVLKRFAVEAWRRADAGELADEELYPCDAQWVRLYDRMHTHEDDETARRCAARRCSHRTRWDYDRSAARYFFCETFKVLSYGRSAPGSTA